MNKLTPQDCYTVVNKGSGIDLAIQEFLNPDHLIKRDGVIILTPQELKKIIDDAFEEGSEIEQEWSAADYEEHKEHYIQSIINL